MIPSLKQKPNIELYTSLKKSKLYSWLRIVIFQMIATILLVYGGMCSMYMTPPYNQPGYIPILNPGHSVFVSCALFLSLCFSGQLTGGHCNPAVTVTLLISKGNKITIKIALVYIISQYIGAVLGGLISWAIVQNFTCPSLSSDSASVYAKTFFAQLAGDFLYCLFILIIVNDKTTFVKSNFWNYILIPIMYFIVREVTGQIDGLNPAATLVYQLFNGIKYENWVPLSNYWLYLVAPLIGSILAGLFFNHFYLPLFTRWKAKK